MAAVRLLLSGSLIFIATMALPIDKMRNESIFFSDYIIPHFFNISIKLYAKVETFLKFSAQKINIKEDEDSFILHGQFSAYIIITKKTNHITAYTGKLNINLLSIQICKLLPEEYEISKTDYKLLPDDVNLFNLSFTKNIEPGAYLLNMKFFRKIFNDEESFLRIFYKKGRTNTWLFVGNVEAIRRRNIFPCPLKSNLVISLESDTLYTVISNFPEIMFSHTFDVVQWTNIYNFPITDTYFLAYNSHDFVNDTMADRHTNVLFRNRLRGLYLIYTKTAFETITTYWNDLLHSNSDTSIVNHVLLPHFPELNISGITSRVIFHSERDTICNIKTIDHSECEIRILRTITRNVVYGFLGNTPFWLKDGIVIYLFNTAYGSNDLFTVQNQQEFLHLNSNFSMEYFLKKGLSEINLLSSYPGYFKAPFTLRMMQYVTTDMIFGKIISNYLKNARNSKIGYFWEVTQKVLSEANLFKTYNLMDRIMSWTKLKSCPVVTVINRDNYKYIYFKIGYYDLRDVNDLWIPVSFMSKPNIKLNRTSFYKNNKIFWLHYFNGLPSSNVGIKYKSQSWIIFNVERTGFYHVNYDVSKTNWQNLLKYWVIPISTSEANFKLIRTSLDKYYRVLWIPYSSNRTSSKINLISFKPRNWVLANVQQTCPYRVNYDIEIWRNLTKQLNSSEFKEIHVLNRAQMIDDAFHLAMENKLQFSVFWNLTSYLRQERHYVPWYSMFKTLEYMSSIFPFPDEKVKVIKDKINATLHQVLLELNYREKIDNSNKDIAFLRQEAARWACTLGLTSCTETAYLYLQLHLAQFQKDSLLPWWKEWTYCNGLIAANYIDWLKARNILLKTTRHNDSKIWEYLACPQNSTVIRKYLESLKTVSSDIETVYIFHSIIARHAKNDKVLDDILRLFSLIKPRRYSIIAAIVDIINHVFSQAQLDKVRIFAKSVEIHYQKFVDQKIQRRLSEMTTQMGYLQQLLN